MPLHDPAHAFVPYPEAPVPHAASGPLAGLRFGVKDLFDVAGHPTGGGNPIVLALSGIKTRSAPTVQRLLDAGAAFAGKTVTDELAFSMNGQNAHFGAPVNGAAPERISGGSSSGSAAAVSNRLVDFALGTDTGGSVRAPASHCHLLGLRPTHGRVSLDGALDLAPSLDTCGWFARDAATFARVAEVLLGADARPLPASVRLLWPTALWTLLVPEAAPAVKDAAGRVQAVLGGATPVDVVHESLDAMYWHFRHLQGREAWMTDGPLIERYAPPLGPGVAERFAWSRQVSDAQVAAAWVHRRAISARLDDLLGDDGVLLLPTMPDVAPLRAAPESALEDYRNRAIRLLCLAGLTGLPQLSLPLLWREDAAGGRAPMGLSLLGPRGSDRSLVALAERLAAAGVGV
ncbi:amidase [Aquabacterium sp. OR-4]|uniref:amidase n=1 Tax=Aquabacterium sp. OR-4 TaxID=2978127 RepID=UPI0028C7A54D|nr:amidase [Aquabacterium sp. OR-4]MDT7834336.1 amidase [Aquabacterium sp. OR-4]